MCLIWDSTRDTIDYLGFELPLPNFRISTYFFYPSSKSMTMTMQTALWDTRRMCLLVLVLATVWAASPALANPPGDPAPPVFPIAYSARIKEVATQGPRPSTPSTAPRHLPNIMTFGPPEH